MVTVEVNVEAIIEAGSQLEAKEDHGLESASDTKNPVDPNDSAYSNSTNSKSRRSRSSKSTNSGSNSSGSSGYGGKPTDSNSTSNSNSNCSFLNQLRGKRHRTNKTSDFPSQPSIAEELLPPPPPPSAGSEPPIKIAKIDSDEDPTPSPESSVEPEPEPELEQNKPPTLKFVPVDEDDVINSVLNLTQLVDTISELSSASRAEAFWCMISMQDGVVMFTSPSITNVLLFPKDMWLGRSFIDFVHPWDKETFAQKISTSAINPEATYGDDLVTGATSVKPSTAQSSTTAQRIPKMELSMFCRIRCYRSLATGFSVKTRDIIYKPFRLKMNFKKVEDESGSNMYLVIKATPFESYYKTPYQIVQSAGPFIIRHTAKGTIDCLGAEAVPFMGFFPKDLYGKDVLELYHIEDMQYIKEIYESILKDGELPKCKPFRMQVHNGDYIKLESEWTSYINPWSKKLEFISGKHYIIEGPKNPNVFEAPKVSKMQKFSEHQKRAASGLRIDIIKMMAEKLSKPVSEEKVSMAQRCQYLASYMENIIKDQCYDANSQYNGRDKANYYEGDSILMGGLSPHYERLDDESSNKTPVSYTQLNYNENLVRYFDNYESEKLLPSKSEPGKLAPDSSNGSHMVISPAGSPNQDRRLGQRSFDADSVGESRVVTAMDEIGEIGVVVDKPKDPRCPMLTESLISKHNQNMEKELINKHRDARSQKKPDQIAHLRRRLMQEKLARCNAVLEQAGISVLEEPKLLLDQSPHGMKRPGNDLFGGPNKYHCVMPGQIRPQMKKSNVEQAAKNMGLPEQRYPSPMAVMNPMSGMQSTYPADEEPLYYLNPMNDSTIPTNAAMNPMPYGQASSTRMGSMTAIQMVPANAFKLGQTFPAHMRPTNPMNMGQMAMMHMGPSNPMNMEPTNPLNMQQAFHMQLAPTNPNNMGQTPSMKLRPTNAMNMEQTSSIPMRPMNPINVGQTSLLNVETTNRMNMAQASSMQIRPMNPINMGQTSLMHMGSVNPMNVGQTRLIHMGSTNPMNMGQSPPMYLGLTNPMNIGHNKSLLHMGPTNLMNNGQTSSLPPGHTTAMQRASVPTKPPGLTPAIPLGPTSGLAPRPTFPMPPGPTSVMAQGPSLGMPPGPIYAMPPKPTSTMEPGPNSAKQPASALAMASGPTLARPLCPTPDIPSSPASIMPPSPSRAKSPGPTSLMPPGPDSAMPPGPIAMNMGHFPYMAMGPTSYMPITSSSTLPTHSSSSMHMGPVRYIPMNASSAISKDSSPSMPIGPAPKLNMDSMHYMPMNPSSAISMDSTTSMPIGPASEMKVGSMHHNPMNPMNHLSAIPKDPSLSIPMVPTPGVNTNSLHYMPMNPSYATTKDSLPSMPMGPMPAMNMASVHYMSPAPSIDMDTLHYINNSSPMLMGPDAATNMSSLSYMPMYPSASMPTEPLSMKPVCSSSVMTMDPSSIPMSSAIHMEETATYSTSTLPYMLYPHPVMYGPPLPYPRPQLQQQQPADILPFPVPDSLVEQTSFKNSIMNFAIAGKLTTTSMSKSEATVHQQNEWTDNQITNSKEDQGNKCEDLQASSYNEDDQSRKETLSTLRISSKNSAKTLIKVQKMKKLVSQSSDQAAEKFDNSSSSFSSLHSSFFKSENGWTGGENSDTKSKHQSLKSMSLTSWSSDEKSFRDNRDVTKIKPPNPKNEPTGMQKVHYSVNLTSDLIYKYQVATRDTKEVLAEDKEKMSRLTQPPMVSDQLGQLYLDLQLQGVAARLTLEEGITSSGSSGEDNSKKAILKTPKLNALHRKREYTKLAMIYEEDALMPSPDEDTA